MTNLINRIGVYEYTEFPTYR